MGELRTTGETESPGGGGFDPPRGDEGLDDWFARRLEAQGISATRPGFPIARILAVLGLVAALGALFWVINSAGGGSSTATPPATHKPTGSSTGGQPNGQGGGGGGGKKHPKVDWRSIPLTILNGYGATGAAGAAQQQLTQQGWQVVAASNASTSSITQTVVVYAPHKLGLAKIVAKRLKLPAPVALADASGVAEAPAGGIAILLGSDGLPAVSG
jgi:LytR cell envelope-related transcriptional attenuator